MKYITLDVETDYDRYLSNAYNPSGSVYAIGWHGDTGADVCGPDDVERVQAAIAGADVIVGHNLKFDLHWLERLGVDFSGKLFYCTMVVEYLLRGQAIRMSDNSLDKLANKYLGASKLDVVRTEYWEKGINTDKVPWSILSEYCAMDCELTTKVAREQRKIIPETMKRLVLVTLADMKLIQEIEREGIKFDVESARTESRAVHLQIMIEQEAIMQNIPYKNINLASPDQLSVLLYGGTIKEKVKVPAGKYGPKALKAGEIKYKTEIIEHHFPRQYKPIKNTEAAKDGYWSTDDVTLSKLKGKGELLDRIKSIRRLRREYDNYLVGIPKIIGEYGWQNNIVHGNYNVCLTSTGRLSSNKPNLQNLSKGSQRFFVSRYL